MFSLEPVPPGPAGAGRVTPTFEGTDAARSARTIVELAADREPGSAGDEDVGDLVRERFEAIEGGEVAMQDFESSYDGEDVTLRNVLLTLPGDSERTLLVVAHRDSADGPGAATSAAATAELLSLADALGRSRPRADADLRLDRRRLRRRPRARAELIENLPRPEAVDAALVISQPGVPDPRAALRGRLRARPRQRLPAARCAPPAAGAAGRYGERDDEPGLWSGLSRLAVPIGLGEQAVAARRGARGDGDQRRRRARRSPPRRTRASRPRRWPPPARRCWT